MNGMEIMQQCFYNNEYVQCNLCEEWYHWYVYQAKECIN